MLSYECAICCHNSFKVEILQTKLHHIKVPNMISVSYFVRRKSRFLKINNTMKSTNSKRSVQEIVTAKLNQAMSSTDQFVNRRNAYTGSSQNLV